MNNKDSFLPPLFASLLLSLLFSAPVIAQETATAPAASDTLLIPIGSQGDAAVAAQLPARGLKQSAVLAQFGEPLSRAPATGEPPINRWQYNDFAVYFEGDTVIHSVLIHRPQPIPVK